MAQSAITGWGKCLPPAILSNDDLSTLVDTSDEWIFNRTGMKERRISHVHVSDLAHIASARALACAGKTADQVDMIIFGGCSFDYQVPNTASRIQQLLKAKNAACMDLNTACTSGMYAMSVANAMIQAGTIKNALIIGAEVISPFMDWTDRNVSILFGDGAAAFYLEADNGDNEIGVQAEALGCFGDSRDILAVEGVGFKYANQGWPLGTTIWNFEGQNIFKQAIKGMHSGCLQAIEKQGIEKSEIDVVVPHQANLRIIESLANKLDLPNAELFVNVERYGNMSAATAPVALVEAVEEGVVKSGSLVLVPAFGAGLSWSAQLIRWGERCTPLESCDLELPENSLTGLELVHKCLSAHKKYPAHKKI
ncbi:MAG: ketoacyl-ACP synthase III [Pseudomonadales bacterium]